MSPVPIRRAALPPFAVGDQVWLNTRNLRTRRPSKKLDFKQAGPFPIIEKISSHAFRLGLPLSMKRVQQRLPRLAPEPARPTTFRSAQIASPASRIFYHVEFEVAAILDRALIVGGGSASSTCAMGGFEGTAQGARRGRRCALAHRQRGARGGSHVKRSSQ